MRLSEFSFTPGAQAAGANIALPAGAPRFHSLTQVEVITLSDGTVAGAIAAKTVVTGAPAAGQARLVDSSTIAIGDALTARDVVRLVGMEIGTYPRVA